MIEIYNIDCMEYMKTLDDNAFALAIVDPPYGINRFKKKCDDKHSRISLKKAFTFNNDKPTNNYWLELFRVSKNQIVWGANNFILPPTEYFCIWDKKQTVDNFAAAEYAWVSMGLKKPAKIFEYSIHQHNGDHAKHSKIHPTQKPVKLYQWLLKNYAKEGDRILDTHLGSGSSAIAAHYGGFEFVGCEIDKDFFEAARKRIDKETRQGDMF